MTPSHRKFVILLLVALVPCLDPVARAGDPPKGDAGGAPMIAPPAEMAELEWMEGDWNTTLTMPPSEHMPSGTKGTGVLRVRKMIRGMAWVQDLISHDGGGDFVARAVLSYNPGDKKWHMWWYDNKTPGGADHSRGTVSEVTSAKGTVTITPGEGPKEVEITESVTRKTLSLESEGTWGGEKYRMTHVTAKDSDTQMTYTMSMDFGRGLKETMKIVATKGKVEYAEPAKGPAPKQMNELAWMDGAWSCTTEMPVSSQFPKGDKGTGSIVTRRGLAGVAWFQDFVSKSEYGGDFEGLGVFSYEPEKKEWVSWWFDSMMAGQAIESRGPFKGGTLKLEGESEWMGQKFGVRMTTENKGPTKHVFKMFGDMHDGKGWVESLEIVYTKKK